MRVIVILGPTGVGKTKLSVELAKKLNGEIISGDSVQVYRKLDIGTAKVTKDEMGLVPHHLIDILDVGDDYSVADFQREVRDKIKDISERGRTPIICGGTGLYIKAALTDYQFSEGLKRDRNKYADKSNEELYSLLQEIDPESAKIFHPNNRVRVLRAIEYFYETKEPISRRKSKDIYLYDARIIGLTMPRDSLYEKINKRVDIMLEKGLLNEVKSLYEKRSIINAIGYNELFDYLDNKLTIEDAVERIKQNSRRYAKRQYTWFNNQMDVFWIDISGLSSDEILERSIAFLNE